MTGPLESTKQRLGAAAALVFILALAGPSTSHATPSNASGTGYVNGQPCNDFCKAYMAWSDRVMARSRPALRSRPKAQIAVRHRKPVRTVYRRPDTRHADLSSFAQVLRRSNAPAQDAETQQVAVAAPPPGPVNPITERLSPAAGIANARFADAGGATDEPPPRTLVSSTAPISATHDTGTTDGFERGGDSRLTASLGLALCALLWLLYWGWFRHMRQAVNRMR